MKISRNSFISLISSAFFIFFILPSQVSATDILNEGFESFNLGTLSGQGQWTGSDSAVVDTVVLAGNQSVFIPTDSDNARWTASGNTNQETEYSFYFRVNSTNDNNNIYNGAVVVHAYSSAGQFPLGNLMFCGKGDHISAKMGYDIGNCTHISNILIEEYVLQDIWYRGVFESNISTGAYRVKINDGNWTEWLNTPGHNNILYNERITFYITDVAMSMYIDNVVWGKTEEAGTVDIIYPSDDENVDGSGFVMELDYWNYGSSSAPYDQMYYQITDEDLNAIALGFADIETDNIAEKKTVYIPDYVLGSYPNAILTVALYNSTTQSISDMEKQTFNIYTTGAMAQTYLYYLDFLYPMDYTNNNPTKTYNNTNDQEIIVSANLGDISCDDIAEGYFDYNSYTNSTFSTIDTAGIINRFMKGGLYLDCRDNEVFLYLKIIPADPGPVYYQVDYYDDTGQTNKLNFLRFAIYYNAVDGEAGDIEFQDPNQNFFCDDMTIYLPNYIGDPFEIKVLNKICAFIFPPPTYFSNQMARINKIFQDKIAFVFMIQTKYNSVKTAIASGSTNPPEMSSGSWNGASFDLQDMFAGSSAYMPWVRTYMGVVMWLAFIYWLLKDIKCFFATKENAINN
ncbi:MAG: hypothetical protein KAU07_00810 [Candidatus Andersenbacteria bacterium]|nr:hypothetical protein [Candidatus Andersenbacteria bacterium]